MASHGLCDVEKNEGEAQSGLSQWEKTEEWNAMRIQEVRFPFFCADRQSKNHDVLKRGVQKRGCQGCQRKSVV